MTSSWFSLSTLNYDARSTTHQIFTLIHNVNFALRMSCFFFSLNIPTENDETPYLRAVTISGPGNLLRTKHGCLTSRPKGKVKECITRRNGKGLEGCNICQILQEARNSVCCTKKVSHVLRNLTQKVQKPIQSRQTNIAPMSP